MYLPRERQRAVEGRLAHHVLEFVGGPPGQEGLGGRGRRGGPGAHLRGPRRPAVHRAEAGRRPKAHAGWRVCRDDGVGRPAIFGGRLKRNSNRRNRR